MIILGMIGAFFPCEINEIAETQSISQKKNLKTLALHQKLKWSIMGWDPS